jgi:hypothetical protein
MPKPDVETLLTRLDELAPGVRLSIRDVEG